MPSDLTPKTQRVSVGHLFASTSKRLPREVKNEEDRYVEENPSADAATNPEPVATNLPEDKEAALEKMLELFANDPEGHEVFEKVVRRSKLGGAKAFGQGMNLRAKYKFLDAVWKDPKQITVKDSKKGENRRITIGKDETGQIQVVFFERNESKVKILNHRAATSAEAEIYHHGR